MNIRDLAKNHADYILKDQVNGFGQSITFIDPFGISHDFVGFSNDIAQVIDPDTGQAVSGRSATITVSVQDFIDKGLSLPVGIADSRKKPWVVLFRDINGNNHKFKVAQSNPDRTIGVVSCILEIYQ